RKNRRFEGRKQIELKNVLKNTTIFSGSDIRSNSQKFEGGEVTAVFGGTKIDLRDVRLAEGGAHLELNVVFGGITLIIPQNMQIEASGTPLFGGCEDKTHSTYVNEEVTKRYHDCNRIFVGTENKN